MSIIQLTSLGLGDFLVAVEELFRAIDVILLKPMGGWS